MLFYQLVAQWTEHSRDILAKEQEKGHCWTEDCKFKVYFRIWTSLKIYIQCILIFFLFICLSNF